MASKRELRPASHLRTLGSRWPNAWKVLWGLRAMRGKELVDWPDWCFLPLAFARSVAEKAPVGPRAAVGGDDPVTREAPLLAALGAWRATQGVYRFDPEVFCAVWDTPLEGRLPTHLFERMPEWSVYVETPGASVPSWGTLLGFFAFLDAGKGGDRARPEALWIVLDFGDEPWEKTLVSLKVPLDKETVEEVFGYLVENARAAARVEGETPERAAEMEELVRFLIHPLSLLLYLCSVSAEYRDATGADRRPAKPVPKKTKKGPRLFPPARPTVWETGYRMGAALRKARAEYARQGAETNRGVRMRPHVRRAHFHGYWKGPRAVPEEREFVLKWLPPIPVNVDDPEDLVPTVRPVEGSNAGVTRS